MKLFKWILGLGMTLGGIAHAAVSDIVMTDVTTRAFSVVWFSDEAINTNTVRVFNDVDGADEITAGLTIVSDSASVPNAHTIGISKVTVSGLVAGQTVFVQTSTDSASGVFEEPIVGSLVNVTTQNLVTRTTAAGGIITNDIIGVSVNDPATESVPLAGALALVQVLSSGTPATGSLGGLVGDSAGSATGVLLNFNNLFDLGSGETSTTVADAVVRIIDYRGLACADVGNQRRVRYGRVPAHEESPAITELEPLVDCFFADRVCDDIVNSLDAQFILASFGEALGTCGFSPYKDVVTDNVINSLDAQSVLSRFGETAPFAP